MILLQTAATDGGNILNGALGLILGGALVEFGRWLLGRKDKNKDDASSIRDELREQIKMLDSRVHYAEQRVDHLQNELDEWKEKYFTLYGENVQLHRDSAAKDMELSHLRYHIEHCPLAQEG